MNRIPRVFLLTACLFAAVPAAAQDSTVVIVVRHGEKAPPATDPDPALSEAGQARARALAEAVRGMGVDAVITTQLQRTQLTAGPVMDELGLRPHVVEVRSGGAAENARETARVIGTEHAGQTVLVVGHSNTVGEIVQALGGERIPEICDPEYSNLYVVVLKPCADTVVRRMTYGAPDPADAGSCRRGS